MTRQWEPPRWQGEGRTGPGPAAPKYKSRKDRNKVRRGKPVGRDQFGDGGSRRIPAKKIARAKKKGCCSYVEAGKAITRLEFRLAVRYIRMDIKARLGVLA
jgi:hypothetical protein